MTVEEPRAGVVRREANRDVVTGGARADDVTLGRVHVVRRRLTSAADDVERVPVQVEGVRRPRGVRGGDGERELDRRVGGEGVDAAAREEVRCALGARKDLEEDGDRGRNEGRAINEELGAVLS